VINFREWGRALLGQLGSLGLSLLLATIVWVVAVNQENPLRVGRFPNAGLPIEVLNVPQGLVLVNKVDQREVLDLRAPADSWQRLEVSDVRAYVDLAGLKPGLQEVEVHVEFADPYVRVLRKRPDRIAVRLDTVAEKAVPVHVEVVDPTSVPLGYVMRPPITSPPTITIRGPRTQVEKVVEAEATVLLAGAKATVDEIRPLILRDSTGNQVTGPKRSPAQVRVQVPVEQRKGYREVSVKAAISGTVASGFWISSISVKPQTVTVVGNPDLVSQLSGFVGTKPIDVTDASESISRQVGLILPDGVSLLGEKGVSVQIEVTPVTGGKTIQKDLQLQGVGPGLTAQSSPNSVDIILSGPLNDLQDLDPSQVQVIVDLSERGPGTYQLKPNVTVPPHLRVQTVVPALIAVTVKVATESRDLAVPLHVTGKGNDLESWLSTNSVTVTLSGPVLDLQSLVTSTLAVTLPLQGLGPGLHMVSPVVSVPTTFTVQNLMPPEVEVILGSKKVSQKLSTSMSWEGLGPGLLISFSPSDITVTVRGPALSVRKLRSEDVRAILDVHGLRAGNYELTPRVELPPGYRLTSITPPRLRVAIRKR